MHRQTGPQPSVGDAPPPWLAAAPPVERSYEDQPRPHENGYEGRGSTTGFDNGHDNDAGQGPLADQPYGGQTFDDQPYGDQTFDDQPYGDQTFGDQSYGDQTYGLRRPDELGSNYGGAGGPGGPDRGGPGDFGDPEYEAYFDDDDVEAEIDYASAVTRNALEWAVVIVGAVLVALLLRATVFQAFYIPSESMETTLLINDRVLVNKVGYRIGDIERGDVVVFVRPDDQPGEVRDLIKRVIALPGETILATDGEVYINERLLDEPYLTSDTFTKDFGPVVVPEGHIFVMGDNRLESFDSRGFGAISQDRVVGRAFVLFWPFNRAGAL